MMPFHEPPWHVVNPSRLERGVTVEGGSHKTIAVFRLHSDAEYAVRAVELYQELVNALSGLVTQARFEDWLVSDDNPELADALRRACNALAKAAAKGGL
jgi:autonomous glycyl radical cofactor GrcA